MSTSSWLSSRSHLDSRWRLWAWQPASTPSTTWGMTMINCLGDLAGTTIVGMQRKSGCARKDAQETGRSSQTGPEVPMRNPSCLTFKTIYFASHQKNSPACAASSIDAAQAGEFHYSCGFHHSCSFITTAVSLFLRIPSLLQFHHYCSFIIPAGSITPAVNRGCTGWLPQSSGPAGVPEEDVSVQGQDPAHIPGPCQW